MSERRFTDKPELAPWAVRGLPENHPAMRENRTLFPSTVVTVTQTEPARLLVSGVNNRKLGKTVEKGAFKGYGLFGLSLEERATCPDDCAVRDICYGNGLQMARRHRIGNPEVFFDRLGLEILELLDEHEGLLVRLHVLGDFPSVDYVAFWADALAESEKLAVYGYTARRTTAWGGDEIGDAIQAVKDQFPDRFRIRWSGPVSRPDGAVVIGNVPKTPRTAEGIVCPAQTDATACCASCGLCWEPNAARDTIVFIKHGPKSHDASATSAMSAKTPVLVDEHPDVRAQPPGLRRIRPIDLDKKFKAAVDIGRPPEIRTVKASSLLVESAYQRDLSGRSISLIRKIVAGWDWAKFKPPICADGPDGLYVIDGQHTAIAAATLGFYWQIPVLVVSAQEVEKRAGAFVSHNSDRLVMSPLQVFHASATAGDDIAKKLLELAEKTGARFPRSTNKQSLRPGDVVAVRQLRGMMATSHWAVERILRIAVASEASPLTRTVTVALFAVLTLPLYADIARLPNSAIANALKGIGDIERASKAAAAETGNTQERACAVMIADACRARTMVAA